MPKESFKPQENIGFEFEKLRELHDKREQLQRRWSELFEKIQALDAKYPSQVQFDEQNRFRGDRGFYTPKDQALYRLLRDEMERVDVEKNPLDQEILKRRFELGTKHLTILNQREDAIWKRTSRHEPNPKNPMDILYVEEWRCVAGDIDARVKIVGERAPSFIEGVRHVAQDLEDTHVLERLEHWPRERNLRFNNVTFEFSSGQKKLLRRRDPDWALPGFNVQKHYDPYEAERDSLSANLPISQAYSFPTIEQAELDKAKSEMNILVRKLKTDL